MKGLTYHQIREKIIDFDRDYDFIFIDTPGRIDLEQDIKQQESANHNFIATYNSVSYIFNVY